VSLSTGYDRHTDFV